MKSVGKQEIIVIYVNANFVNISLNVVDMKKTNR